MEAQATKDELKPEVENRAGTGEKPERMRTAVLLSHLENAKLLNPLLMHIRGKKKMLISFGVKTSYKGNEAQTIEKIIDSLPEKGYETMVEDWLEKQTKKKLEEYLSVERHDNKTLAEHLSPLVLFWHGRANKPEDIAELTKLYIAASHDARTAEVTKVLSGIRPMKKGSSESFNHLIIGLVDDPGSGMGSENSAHKFFSLMVQVAVAIRFGQWEVIDSVFSELKQMKSLPIDREILVKAITDHLEATKPSGTMPALKVRTASPGEFQSTNGLEVLTLCTKHQSEDMTEHPLSFSKVLAVKRSSEADWKETTLEQARELFPSEGSIVHFPGKGYPPLPEEGEYGVWRVTEQQNTERQAEDKDRFTFLRASAKVMAAQQVRSFEEAGSTNVKEVIRKLDDVRNSGASTRIRNVIRLADGLFIQPPDGIDALLDSDRDTPLNSWKNIDVIQLSSGLNLHVGELPDTNRLWDMSNERDIVTKALEQHLMLDRSHRERLAAVIDEIKDDQMLEQPIKEMQLDALEWRGEEIDKLVQALHARLELKAILDKRREGELAKAQDASTIDSKTEATREKTKALKDRKQATLLEVHGIMEEADQLMDKHFNRVRQLGRSYVRKSRQERRSWFPDIEKAITEYSTEVEKLEKSANNGRER